MPQLTGRDRLVIFLIALIGVMLVVGGWHFFNWLNNQGGL
jgi:hypothetical protein